MNTLPAGEYITTAAADVYKKLNTSPKGLTTKNADARLVAYGRNELSSKQVHWWQIFGRQFASSFIYLLLGSAALSFALGKFVDGTLILLFVGITVVLGFFQEYRSEHSLRLLKKYLAPTAKAWRDDKLQAIPRSNLVPGDVVEIVAGDIIPADLRLVDLNSFVINESVLTGESVPVNKQAAALSTTPSNIYQSANILWSGTTVTAGHARGVVVATGNNTAIGSISKLTTETNRVSTFEKNLRRFSQFILYLVLLTLAIIYIINIVFKGINTASGIIELSIFAVALAVSVIPEALPVITTFALSHGAVQLAKKQVVVKRLSAIEDLGSIQVLCTDKTGTITENRMHVADVNGHNPKHTVIAAAVAAPPVTTRTIIDPFDQALWNKLTSPDKKTAQHYNQLTHLPFDPQRKMSSALVSSSTTGRQLIIRGAPEEVWKSCGIRSASQIAELRQWYTDQGLKGHRVLAVASKDFTADDYQVKDEKSGFALLGHIAFADPIKKSTKAALAKAEKLGVQVKIITGDGPTVAGAVAASVHLIADVRNVITGEALMLMTPAEQSDAVEHFHVFARVTPEQKHHIVQLLQKKFEVGFLGEGINDAPALKASNIGIVVQEASDIAREAADIVLLQSSLEVIINGIEEGRKTFVNTTKYITATLASNFGNFYAVALATLFIADLPMLPIQLLLLNLATDFPMIAIATDNTDADTLKTPRNYNMRELLLISSLLGVVSMVFDLIVFSYFRTHDIDVLRTNWFIASVITELLLLFSIRTKRLFIFGSKPSTFVMCLTVFVVATTVAVTYIPFTQKIFQFVSPTGMHLVAIAVLAIAYFGTTETVKLLYNRFTQHD